MKKLVLVTLFGFASATAIAAPVGQTFTDFGVGLDLTSTKYKGAKRATGVGVIVDYGIDYGNDFVGIIEGKVKLNKSKLVDDQEGPYSQVKIDEKWRASVSYLQGYRVLPDLLPYVKASYVVAQIKGHDRDGDEKNYTEHSFSKTSSGFGIGLGAKYAVSSNFELGVEYLRSRIKFDNENQDANTLGASATYRF